MKAFLIWVLMSSGPQGEVAQSVHLTRAECQASLGKIATNDRHMPPTGDAKCVQSFPTEMLVRAER